MSSISDPRRREILWGVPAVREETEVSYEEQRIRDYIHAYQTTGRPPLPVPQVPTNPQDRKALGLPPLFEPHIEVSTGPLSSLSSNPPSLITPASSTLVLSSSSSLSAPASASAFVDPRQIPEVQKFATTRVNDGANGEFLGECISLHPMYRNFSHEELRVIAYGRGKRYAPEAISVPPANVAKITSTLSPAPTLLLPNNPGNQVPLAEIFQSINTIPKYFKHSFEELRLACMRAGRELTSDEIMQQNATLKLSV
ncbi:hypothetical protein K474DRAFT_1773719 [Panus rudis PR-1116 ss-1]|nr:hypothetical protein K474DRAFT_1773719 [Panus rudis PR-1116 ss-1]